MTEPTESDFPAVERYEADQEDEDRLIERRVVIRGRRLEDGTIQVHMKEKVLTPTFALLCLAVLMSSLGALGVYIDNRQGREIEQDTQEIVEDIAVVVGDIEQRNTPEAIAARQEALNDIILEVACNDRETLEDFSEQLFVKLIDAGVLPEGTSVTLQPDPDCVEN